jgi:hypothetical protein
MNKIRIYIETCPIIDVIKGRVGLSLSREQEDDLWYTEQCLKAAWAGEIQVVTSMLTIAECRRQSRSAAHRGNEASYPLGAYLWQSL